MRYIDIHRHYHVTEGDLETYMTQADDLGIEQVGMSTCGPLFNQHDNEGVIRAKKQYPGRILGFGYIRLGLDGPQKVDELYALGFEGLKVIIPAAFYDDRSLWPVYARAEALGMPINFHCGITGGLSRPGGHQTSSRFQRPICLDAIARDFPDLRLLMPHLGFPWVQEACAVIATWPNIYWDLTGTSLLRVDEEWLMDHFLLQGEDIWQSMLKRLVWASDTHPPQILIDRYEEVFELMGVTAEQKQDVYRHNAMRLMGLQVEGEDAAAR